MKRRSIGVGLTVLVIGAGSGGWVAARNIRSPEEVAAQQGPPAASRITVPVIKTVLSSTLITRGTVRFGEPKEVLLASSGIKAGTSQVVTSPATTGAEVAEGGKLMEIGGRPVFALTGDTPMYRDLRPGDTGTDVRQLENALVRLGFKPGTVDDTFDANTESAVEAWYRSTGFEAFGPTDAQRTALGNARESASKAAEALRQAQQTLADVRKPPTPDKALQADEQVATARAKLDGLNDDAAKQLSAAQTAVDAKAVAVQVAQRSLDDARTALDRARSDATDSSPIDDAQAGVAKAQAAVAQAERGVVKARQGVPDAQTAIDDAERALADTQLSEQDANDAVARAQQALDTANNTPAKLVPQGNNTFTVDEEGRKANIASAEAGVRQAKSGLRSAQSATRQAQRNLDTRKNAVDDAANAVAVAQQALADAHLAVERAERDVVKAQRSMADREQAVADATTKLAQSDQAARQAQSDLNQATAGVPVAQRQIAETRRAAQAQLAIAEAARKTSTNPADTTSASAQVRSAEQAKLRADAELADLEAEVGIVVPANEVVFFPTLPLRIDTTKLARGEIATGAVMTVTTSRLAVDSSLDLADAQLAHVGDKVQIDASDFDISLAGYISELATTPGTDGVDATKVYMEITPDEGASDANGSDDANSKSASGTDDQTSADDENGPRLGVLRRPGLSSLNGQSVKITVPVRSTGGPVLAVPTPAVSAAADGTSRVEVEDTPGAPTRFVTVRVGLAAEGLVAVTPVNGKLEEGSQVVVGTATPTDVEAVTEPQDEGGAGSSSDTVAGTDPDTVADSAAS